ncbi:hypothetical protein BDV18DRAFT_142890 [Aspergillus unguis]
MSTTLPHSMVQSMAHSLKPLPLRTPTNHQDPLLHVERQARHIQRNLQYLIDAQSEGLLAGLSGQSNGNELNESYVSSELSSPKGTLSVPMPIRQPPGKKIGLRSARVGIFSSMHNLMRLRQEELAILASRQEDMESGLNDIDTFNDKRASLERAISNIHDESESRLSQDLREKSVRLEEQIHEMENKLAQMKAQHRHVVQELSQIENTVQSKLSSYKASLSLLENDVRKFLANPPVEPRARDGAEKDFYSLKPSRRSLEMAQEHWTKERSDLEHRQDEVDAEIEALEQGGDLWKQVVKDISGFEKRLKANMSRSIQSQEQLLQDGLNKDGLAPTMMEDLEHTTQLVERHLAQAEGKNWKLLVCCISAELQALREAKEMLLDAFGLPKGEPNPSAHSHHEEESHTNIDPSSPTDPLGVDNPEPPADLLQDIDRRNHEATKSEDEEDDEPDPAWLLPET